MFGVVLSAGVILGVGVNAWTEKRFSKLKSIRRLVNLSI
tara:strand:- start:5239 stop:5355 length:117 start_codon:yes stop_codon:yes gene_type:complete